MANNVYIVLGNGFSIDLIQKMGKDEEIDLANLFSKGEHVLYPKTNNRGFLSRKYTPDLWSLGARTYMSFDTAMQLVTDVITCANVYNLSIEKRPNEVRDSSNTYIHAYSELSSYLRYLFIYYDSLVLDDDLNMIIDKIELINYIKDCLLKKKKVYIITYNYDIFLERILKIANINYDIYGFDDSGAEVVIFKPHGSISFSFKIKIQDYSPYNIRDLIEESISQNASDFEIKYDLKDDYPIVNAIIPPAGDAERFGFGWIKDIRKGIDEIVSKSTSKDEMMLFGLSYWHVDRNEIDEILLSIDNKMEVRFVNPKPPTALDAVLTSLFQNYIHFSSSKLVMEDISDGK